MAEPGDTRVAVYFDFDNIVISRYDQVHGRNTFQRDRVRGFGTAEKSADSEVAEKLKAATVDVGAIIDFASSFGTLVLTRAYADWSAPINADYRGQLVSRAVDLVQLFPAAAYGKNGADIRLAVDAVEDMFRLPDLTHVVIVAGDSDYIALAQRCKRLGRYVVGIGVAGSTSRSLAAACDELVTYDDLPGLDQQAARTLERESPPSLVDSSPKLVDVAPSAETAAVPDPARKGDQQAATRLLKRALQIGHEKNDAEWLHSSEVKNQMKRMDPSFNEKSLGFRSFSDFARSRTTVAEFEDSNSMRIRRVDGSQPASTKPATKQPAAKKTTAKKAAVKKAAVKKAVAKKAPAKGTSGT